MVGLLVHATTDDKKSPNQVSYGPGFAPVDVYPGVHHDYLVEFDRDGNYKKTVELPAEYRFWRIGALVDDSLLALAYDRTNSVARFLLLDSGGKIIRPLELPSQMRDNPELTQGESGEVLNQARAESSLSWWLFAPARHRLLLYQAHSKAPLLEVGAGGVVREVPLEAPKGYVLNAVIPSNDR